jgi:hypothetical protein
MIFVPFPLASTLRLDCEFCQFPRASTLLSVVCFVQFPLASIFAFGLRFFVSFPLARTLRSDFCTLSSIEDFTFRL